MEEAEEGWVRPLRPEEAQKEEAHASQRPQITCYRLGLCSAAPLDAQLLRAALSGLYRTCPHLRLRLGQHEGRLWFRSMQEERLLFEVCRSTDVAAEVERQLSTPFESLSGPLWRCVWLPDAPCEVGLSPAEGDKGPAGEDKSEVSAPPQDPASGDKARPAPDCGAQSGTPEVPAPHWAPEVAEALPHTCTLLLAVHHVVTDGFTSLRTCRQLVSLLDRAALDRAKLDETTAALDDAEQIGAFSDGAETARLLQERQEFLDGDPKRKEMIQRSVEAVAGFRAVCADALPPPAPPLQRSVTASVVRSFTADETSKLLAFFREEKISLNSGFLAMVNLALVEMLKRRGCAQRVYGVTSCSALDLRRYWAVSRDRALGCHVGAVSLLTDTAASSIHQFLEYAHDVQTNMLDHITYKRALDEALFSDPSVNETTQPRYWHCLSNVGDVSDVVACTGEAVQLGFFSRHVSCHVSNSTFLFAVHTFRWRLCYTLAYSARTVSAPVAAELAATLDTLMLDIVRQMP